MTVTPIDGVRYWYDEQAAAFIAPGRVSLPTLKFDLSKITSVPDTFGIPAGGPALTPYNASTVDTFTLPSGGGVIEDAIIYGDLKPPASGATWTLRRCLLVGGNHVPSGASAVVDCNGARTGSNDTTNNDVGRIILEQCEIAPRRPSLNRDGIVGHKFSLINCLVQNTVDAVGAFITSNKGTHANVKIIGNKLANLGYGYPDYINGVSGAAQHTDGTHDDTIQLQGGGNVEISFNLLIASTLAAFAGSGTNPDKPWLIPGGWSNGACIVIQDNTGVGTFTKANTIIRGNRMAGGLAHINIKPGVAFTLDRNEHFRDTAIGTGHSGYWIRFDQQSTNDVDGLATEVWIDGPYAGQILTSPRDRGIHTNA